MKRYLSNGVPLDQAADAWGELTDSSDLLGQADALRSRMRSHGYLFFRGLLDEKLVAAAREEILLKYATIGEIDAQQPLDEAIYNADSALHKVNLRAFSQSVRSGHYYESVILAEPLLNVHEVLLEGEVRAFDFRWPRFARPGEGCGIHCDGPYMNRATDKIFSSWIPLGRIERHEGALMILERGDRHESLLRSYLSKDADRDQLQWLSTDPGEFRKQFGTRWLTTDFQAGDVLCFTMDTVHGALDNMSTTGRCRLSSDSRYQLLREPADERWNGSDPIAHGADKVFYPGLGNWNNEAFQDEWKRIDARGRLILNSKD